MIRKQIYISEESEQKLKQLSLKRQVPEAVLVREALERYLSPSQAAKKVHKSANPLDRLVGICKGGPRDAAVNHDFYLYGLPKKG